MLTDIRCLYSTLVSLPKLLVQVMEDISRRLTKLESATTQATQSVVDESVRSEQSRAVTESALAQQRTYQVSLLCHMPLVLLVFLQQTFRWCCSVDGVMIAVIVPLCDFYMSVIRLSSLDYTTSQYSMLCLFTTYAALTALTSHDCCRTVHLLYQKVDLCLASHTIAVQRFTGVTRNPQATK